VDSVQPEALPDRVLEKRWRMLGMSLIGLAVAVGGFVGFVGAPEPSPLRTEQGSAPAPSDASMPSDERLDPPGVIVVHVAGAVAEPGLVELSQGARVADAIAAAGGMTDDALETAINLAAPVDDGVQVVVPVAGEFVVGVAGSGTGDGRVYVNRASESELDALPGVGPVLAAEIVAHRDIHGPFAVVEDLLDVPGIGEAKLASMRDSVAIP
jgi:competence protein ComEA